MWEETGVCPSGRPSYLLAHNYCRSRESNSGRTGLLALSVLILFPICCGSMKESESCAGKAKYDIKKNARFLLYDVNPGEGFNLRRDVYMRVANLVYLLNRERPWVLVLPPWVRMWHWRSRDVEQERLKWSAFFDVESLGKHVPVIELEDYIKRQDASAIDEVYYLQGVDSIDDWNTIKIDKCERDTSFRQDSTGKWRHLYFDFDELYADKFQCLAFFGQLELMKSFLNENTTGRFVFLPRAENLLHGDFGEHSDLFWKARRSMVYAKPLRDVGDLFRKTHLDSDDERDSTFLKDWTTVKKESRKAIGGPYIAVHLRRGDHLHVRGGELPSMKEAAKYVKKLLQKLALEKVFVATDGTKKGISLVVLHLRSLFEYGKTEKSWDSDHLLHLIDFVVTKKMTVNNRHTGPLSIRG
ncbi:GDP-fucose protein O-fucosyltransferase 2-like isoform X2 [Ostrea edulis]|uniref:GDP-fucose protein O-fucosyltransferase 2-like isoform X2 n=1 Tax=Ostrea edulis TaxID=37623 RepID=UPI0024AFCD68|nr:GDP-fucose protein O-fucosyltransferase 2-like isoform X2 [Ostrea edulis]